MLMDDIELFPRVGLSLNLLVIIGRAGAYFRFGTFGKN